MQLCSMGWLVSVLALRRYAITWHPWRCAFQGRGRRTSIRVFARRCAGARTVKDSHSRLFSMRCVTLFASSLEIRTHPWAIAAGSACRHTVGSQSECIVLRRTLGRVRSCLCSPPAKGKSLCSASVHYKLCLRVNCKSEGRSLSLSLRRVPDGCPDLLSSVNWPHG